MVKYNATTLSTITLEVGEEQVPAGVPSHVLDTERTIADWRRQTKLVMCEVAVAEAGYDAELALVEDGDAEEVGDMVAAVEAVEGIKKPTVKKFKRKLAKVRGKRERFE
jgi:hypothetical protein